MTDNIGERIASLEAALKSFRHEMLKDNEYLRDKVDSIVTLLSRKVDRAYCYERHGKLDERLGEAEKDGKHSELEKRIRALELKAPAIIQQIVLVLSMGIVMAVVSHLINQLP